MNKKPCMCYAYVHKRSITHKLLLPAPFILSENLWAIHSVWESMENLTYYRTSRMKEHIWVDHGSWEGKCHIGEGKWGMCYAKHTQSSITHMLLLPEPLIQSLPEPLIQSEYLWKTWWGSGWRSIFDQGFMRTKMWPISVAYLRSQKERKPTHTHTHT
jgi:hypothetical protein